MNITEKLHFSFNMKHPNQLLRVINRRMKPLRRLRPSSVQIYSEQRTSIVSIDYPIRVQHRNNFENIPLSQPPSLR